LDFEFSTFEISLEDIRSLNLRMPSVAVIDSGIDATHPDLSKVVDSAWGVISDSSLNWKVCKKYRHKNNDKFGHGTSVASIISQIAPQVKISDYCVLGKSSLGAAGKTLAALEHAILDGHRIINMSLAVTPRYKRHLLELLELAFSKGVLVVASQRNFPRKDLGLPAELSFSAGVNCMSAQKFCHVVFNDAGLVEFGTLGEKLVAASSGGGYTTVSGTSYATPVISGICSLLLSKWPDLEVFEIKTILKNSHFAV